MSVHILVHNIAGVDSLERVLCFFCAISNHRSVSWIVLGHVYLKSQVRYKNESHEVVEYILN